MRLYLILAGALAFMALAALAFWYRGEAISARADAEQQRVETAKAVDANAAALATIRRQAADAAKTDQIVAQMANDIAAIREQTDQTNDAIASLKETNADVAAYLRGAVPDGLRELLNH